jgi:hypothetical protein
MAYGADQAAAVVLINTAQHKHRHCHRERHANLHDAKSKTARPLTKHVETHEPFEKHAHTHTKHDETTPFRSIVIVDAFATVSTYTRVVQIAQVADNHTNSTPIALSKNESNMRLQFTCRDVLSSQSACFDAIMQKSAKQKQGSACSTSQTRQTQNTPKLWKKMHPESAKLAPNSTHGEWSKT